MSILEELWYGNIEPAEYDISPDKKYKDMLQLISRNEDKLLATMTDAQKELFTKYADCVREYQVMAECLLFQSSFRLGVRIMLEVMAEYSPFTMAEARRDVSNMLDEYEKEPRSVRERLRNHQQEQIALRKKEKDRDR